MSGEHRVSHPGHTVHSHDSHGTGAEHAVLGNVSSLHVTEDHHQGTSSQHEHLDSQRHGAAFRTQLREHTEDGNDNDHADEQEQREPLLLGKHFADQGRRVTVHILLHFRIGNQFLEFFVLVEVLTTEPREQTDEEHTDGTTRDRDREEVNETEVLAVNGVTFHQSDHGDGSHSSRRADHAHLRADGRSSHRTFRTDTVLNSHVIDNRQHRVNNVAGTAENREEPADVRSEEADVLRVLTQNLFCDLQKAIKTAGSLQRCRTAHHGQNRQNNINGGFARFQAEAENQNNQTDTA